MPEPYGRLDLFCTTVSGTIADAVAMAAMVDGTRDCIKHCHLAQVGAAPRWVVGDDPDGFALVIRLLAGGVPYLGFTGGNGGRRGFLHPLLHQFLDLVLGKPGGFGLRHVHQFLNPCGA